MPFYTKSEKVKITMLIQSAGSSDEKQSTLDNIKANAQLRHDGYKKRIRVFLNALSSFKNGQAEA